MGWKHGTLMGLVVGCALVLGVARSADAGPYRDTRDRFHVNLADGWSLAPRFGDVRGMTFQRKLAAHRGGGTATFTIVVDETTGTPPASVIASRDSELVDGKGYTAAGRRRTKLGGHEALHRAYRFRADGRPHRLELYVLRVQETVYELAVRGRTRDLKRVKKEVDRMLASFRATPRSPGAVAAAAAQPAPDLNGRWRNDDGLELHISKDGKFVLDTASGIVEVTSDTLTMIIPGQGRESFTFVHNARRGTLTLTSPNLPTPMVYRRLGDATAAPPPKQKPAAPTVDPKALQGRWLTEGATGSVVLELLRDGTFRMGPAGTSQGYQGRWSVAEGKLRLERSMTEIVTYGFRLEGDRLVLHGGDLDRETAFRRSGGS